MTLNACRKCGGFLNHGHRCDPVAVQTVVGLRDELGAMRAKLAMAETRAPERAAFEKVAAERDEVLREIGKRVYPGRNGDTYPWVGSALKEINRVFDRAESAEWSLTQAREQVARVEAERDEALKWLDVHRKVGAEAALGRKQAEEERDERQAVVERRNDCIDGMAQAQHALRTELDALRAERDDWKRAAEMQVEVDQVRRRTEDIKKRLVPPEPVAEAVPVAWRSLVPGGGFITSDETLLITWRKRDIPYEPLFLHPSPVVPAPVAQPATDRALLDEYWRDCDGTIWNTREQAARWKPITHVARYRIVRRAGGKAK